MIERKLLRIFGLGFALGISFFCDATASNKAFEPFEVVPSTASPEMVSMPLGYCGRETSLYFFQIKVDDIYRATGETSRILDTFSAEPPGDGCEFFAAWRPDADVRDLQIRVSRWIRESDLIPLAKQVSKLGALQYANEIPYQGEFEPTVIDELKQMHKKLEADSGTANSPATRSAVGSLRQNIERKEAALRDTKDKVLIHIFLVQSRNPKLNTVPQGPESSIPDIEKNSFSSLQSELGKQEVPVRREAASALGAFVAQSQKLTSAIGGIGLQLGINARGLIAAALIKEMPAEHSDIAVGDMIVAIDGTPAAGKSINAAAALIRGTVGSKVALTVRTPGQSKDRSVVLSRKTLFPTLEEIASAAETCASDSDGLVRVRCLAALRAAGDKKDAQKVAKKLGDLLYQVDEGVRKEAFTELGKIWDPLGRRKIITPCFIGHTCVVSGFWSLNICLGDAGRAECARSPGDLPPETFKNAGLRLRLEVDLPSNAIQGFTKEDFCSLITWSLDGDCVWDTASHFHREETFLEAHTTSFSIQDHGRIQDLLENVSVSASLTNAPSTATVGDIYLEAGQSLSGKIFVPGT
jgi:hypothetical protein